MIDKLYFVTSNKGKAEEATAILGMPVVVAKQELEEIQSLDLEEIVEKKALAAFEIIKAPVIVDDTALEIEAWKGFPGPFIKYILTTVGAKGLLKMLKSEKSRKAKAVAAIGYTDGKMTKVFIGEVEGKIASKELGKQGFGWDPIFVPKGGKKSYAQMGMEEKNRISHRKLALEKFKKFLNGR